LAFLEAEAAKADSFYAMSVPLRARENGGDLQAGWLMTAFD
jgi:hypothetical protein